MEETITLSRDQTIAFSGLLTVINVLQVQIISRITVHPPDVDQYYEHGHILKNSISKMEKIRDAPIVYNIVNGYMRMFVRTCARVQRVNEVREELS